MRSCFRDIVRLNHLKYKTYCSSSFASRLSSHPPHLPIFAGFHLVAMSSYNCFCFLNIFRYSAFPSSTGHGPTSGEVKGTGLTLFLSLSIPFPFSFSSDDTWFVDKYTHVQVNDYRLHSSEFFRASTASLPHTSRRTPWAIRNEITRIGLRCLSLSSRSPKSHNLRQTNAVFDYFVTSYAKVHQTIGIPQVMKTFLSLAFLLPGYTILLRQSPSSALILPLSTAL